MGFILGFCVAKFGIKNNHDAISIREYDQRYQFIRPLLICQIDEQTENYEYKPLEEKIESFINQSVKTKQLIRGSVYFRDLNTGRWIGVNEEKLYSPASLLKVPIMMSYFKEVENDPDILNKKYLYTQKPDDINPLITKRILQSGKEYSVMDLIRGMIIQSDNSAKDILSSHINPNILNETYNSLDIHGAYDLPHKSYEISAKKYALFFRVLYNGTLLSREMSNKAILLLNEVEFDKGLRAGTPENIQVAHKYGINAVSDGKGYKVELSDCGIVYSKPSPYLLCVMTEGDNPYVLADVIKKIAEIVYRSVITENL